MKELAILLVVLWSFVSASEMAKAGEFFSNRDVEKCWSSSICSTSHRAEICQQHGGRHPSLRDFINFSVRNGAEGIISKSECERRDYEDCDILRIFNPRKKDEYEDIVFSNRGYVYPKDYFMKNQNMGHYVSLYTLSTSSYYRKYDKYGRFEDRDWIFDYREGRFTFNIESRFFCID